MKNSAQGHRPPASVAFAKVLADETRQKILQLCACQALSVMEIVEQLDVAQPTVSHHLAILKEAGLVEARHDGKQVFYKLNHEQMALCCGRLLEAFAPEEETSKTRIQPEDAEPSLTRTGHAQRATECEGA